MKDNLYPPKKTLITCHQNADFDAICSLFAISCFFPDAQIVYPGSQEKIVQAFVHEVIDPLFYYIAPKDADFENVERLVIVDTSHTGRLTHIRGFLEKCGLLGNTEALQKSNDVEIVIFDHHPQTNIEKHSGRIEIVGSTSTLICEEIKKTNIGVPCEILHLLGLGLYSDTGAFTYNSVTVRDTKALTWLIEQGFEPDFVTSYVSKQINKEQLFALNDLVESARFYDIAGIKFILASSKFEEELYDIASLTSLFLEIYPCDVLFMVAAMDGKVQVVARSKDYNVDVGQIMALLGGGGHSYAAAATVKDKTMHEVITFIESQITLFSHRDKTVRRLMSAPVVSVDEADTIDCATDTMMHYGFKAIPILMQKTKQCVGILEYQIAAKAVKHGLGQCTVSQFMSRSIRYATLETDLQTLMDIIIEDRQRLVPIVACQTLGEQETNDDFLKDLPVIGVVTRTDLVRLFLDEQSTGLSKKKAHRLNKRNVQRLLRVRTPKECVKLLEIVGQLAEELGVSAYVVGGFVRDLIMDRERSRWPNMDIDLVVEGDGILFAHCLAGKLGGRVREHKEFMTAIVLFPSSALEDQNLHFDYFEQELRVDVATARLEYYQSPAVLPTVELSSIRMDLNRRDFTINAMAIKLNTSNFGELEDYFDGQGDIKQKTIRMLHALSFVDDPTRALRAIRFEQRYEYKICMQCDRLIRNAIALQVMQKLDGKRITTELEIILKEENVLQCIMRMQDFGLLKEIHPCLELSSNDEIDFVSDAYKVLDWYRMLYLKEPVDNLLFFVLVMSKGVSGSDIQELLERLSLPQNQIEEYLAIRNDLISVLPKVEKWFKNKESMSSLHLLLKNVAMEVILYMIVRLEETQGEEIKKRLSYYIYQVRHEKIDLTGNVLLQLGVRQGPLIGQILQKVLFAKIDGLVSGFDEELAYAEICVKECQSRNNGKE